MLASHLLDKQQLKIISFQTLISYSYCFQSDIDISTQVTISTQGMKKTFIVLRRANKIYALSLILIMMTLLKKVFISCKYLLQWYFHHILHHSPYNSQFYSTHSLKKVAVVFLNYLQGKGQRK